MVSLRAERIKGEGQKQVADDSGGLDDKKKGTETPSTNSVPASPGPVVNQLDDAARETFATGRPLEDAPELHQCKHCKKTVLKTIAKSHVANCLKIKKEKAQKKKEQKEAREREKREMDGEKKDEEGDTRMDSDEEEESPEKKSLTGLKSAKKSAGKKVDDDVKKGKKRKAVSTAFTFYLCLETRISQCS
jgi:SAGA-associated factor 73